MREVSTPIRIVSFDFGGVFPMGKRKYNYEEALYKSIRKISERNIDKKEVYEMFNKFIEHDSKERIPHKSEKLIPYLASYLKKHDEDNIQTSKIVLNALLDKNTIYPLTQDIESIFKYLAAHEIKIALISDSIFPTIMRRIILQNWGLLQYFDLILTSQEHGRKSGLKIFKKLINHFNAKPGEILHIGDKLSNDIIPAKKIGLQTCLILNGKLNEDINSKVQPDFIIDNLREIKQIIAKKGPSSV